MSGVMAYAQWDRMDPYERAVQINREREHRFATLVDAAMAKGASRQQAEAAARRRMEVE